MVDAAAAWRPVGRDHDAEVALAQALCALDGVLTWGELLTPDVSNLQVLEAGDDERVGKLCGLVAG